MPFPAGATAASGSTTNKASHSTYSVLLYRHTAQVPVSSPGSTSPSSAAAPASSTSPSLSLRTTSRAGGHDLALRVRLRIKDDQLRLVLTYDPRKQLKSAVHQSVTECKSRTGPSSSNILARQKSSDQTKRRSAPATTGTTTVPVIRSRPPETRQYYEIALTEASPVAAQQPLSTELRARLRLNLHEGEAVTYSSHSTPRAVSLAMNSSSSPITFATNFVLPPNRQPQLAKLRRDRQESPPLSRASTTGGISASTHVTGVHAGLTTHSFGQYLNAAEPFHGGTGHMQSSHLHVSATSPSPHQEKSNGPPAAPYRTSTTSFFEADATMVHHSKPNSRLSSRGSSRVVTPVQESTSTVVDAAACGLNRRVGDDVGSPLPDLLLAPSCHGEVGIHDYADLLLVAFFGVPVAAGVPNLSFSTDDHGTVLVQKRPKKFGARLFTKSLFKWFVPSKESEGLRRHGTSPSAISNLVDSISSGSHSPQVSPAQRHAPGKLPKRGKTLHHPSPSANTTPMNPSVPVSVANVDPSKVLELPFILNQYDTFYLRFLSEEDLRSFLCHYVDLQARLSEVKGDVLTSPLWHPKQREPTNTQNRFAESGTEEYEGESTRAEQSHSRIASASTACYDEYPRNEAALGVPPNGEDPLSSASPASQHQSDRQGSGSTLTRQGNRCMHGHPFHHQAMARPPAPPMGFFRSRRWVDYNGLRTDPRFGIPFAEMPLYLWQACLPLASAALYTCYRGFLIVEQVPPEVSCSEDELHAEDPPAPPELVRGEIAKRRLNTLVNRLLTPVRTVQSPPRRPPPHFSIKVPTQVSAEGVSVSPLPTGNAHDSCDDLLNSRSTSGHASTGSSWDSVKLVLPSAEEAQASGNVDHLTTVKDVFLCVSETHLLFINSFGRLRFQCSMDEIALLTHSAPTPDFPTYPFLRFRLKSSDYFGAPTFVLTFTLLPEVSHEVRLACTARVNALHHPHHRLDEESIPSNSPSSPLSSASSTTLRSLTPTPLSVARSPVTVTHPTPANGALLEAEMKEQLLQRQEAFLNVFEAVCPRHLQKEDFSDLIAGERGQGHRIPFSHFASRPSKPVSGTPLAAAHGKRPSFATGGTPSSASATAWMVQHHNTDSILCVKVAADDIELWDEEGFRSSSTREGSVKQQGSYPGSALLPSDASWRQGRAATGSSPEMSFKCAPPVITPRWGLDAPSIVLQDTGRDMDFSLETATRAMPLLATKEEVCAGFDSASVSSRHSYYPDREEEEGKGSTDGSGGGAADDFVPMAPKKKRSIILRRTYMADP